MSDSTQRPIAKSSTALLVSQMSLAAVNFLAAAYLLRALSKEQIAVTAVMDILFSIFSFSSLGLLNVVVQQGPAALQSGKDRNRAYSLVKCGLLYQTIGLLIFGLVTFIYAPQVSQLLLKTTEYAWAVRLLVPGVIATNWFSALQLTAQVSDDFYLIAVWNFIDGLCRPLLSIGAYWMFGFQGFLTGVVISDFIPVLGMGWFLRKFFFNAAPLAPFWSTFRYGLPFYAKNFLRFGYTQFDQAIVAVMLTPNALASYNAARRFRKNITIAIESFRTPTNRRMAALNQESDAVQAAFFQKAARYNAFLMLPLTLLVAAASPWLMLIFGGSKYAADWPLLALMSIGQAAYAAFTLYGGAIFARFHPWATLLIDSINGGVNFIVGPLLILWLAQYGVALSQLVGYLAAAVCAYILLQRLPGYRYQWEHLRLVGPPLGLACLLIILGELFYFRVWVVPLYICLAGLIYFIMLSRGFQEADWFHLRSIVPSLLLPYWGKVEAIFREHFAHHQDEKRTMV